MMFGTDKRKKGKTAAATNQGNGLELLQDLLSCLKTKLGELQQRIHGHIKKSYQSTITTIDFLHVCLK